MSLVRLGGGGGGVQGHKKGYLYYANEFYMVS
jgi:hypothetical protein